MVIKVDLLSIKLY